MLDRSPGSSDSNSSGRRLVKVKKKVAAARGACRHRFRTHKQAAAACRVVGA